MKSRRTLALPQKCVDALRKLWALQLTCRRRDPWQEGAAEGGGYDVAGSVIPGQDREGDGDQAGTLCFPGTVVFGQCRTAGRIGRQLQAVQGSHISVPFRLPRFRGFLCLARQICA
jgi:hypothetical protein